MPKHDLFGLHIIVTGNPVDGFEFFGPFKTGEDAIIFGNTDPHLTDEWWVAKLHDQHGERDIAA